MRITAIKQQVKNPERASIFVDGKYSFSLSISQLVEEKLKIGNELDEPMLADLKKKSDDGKLKMRALEWVLSRPHSIREFRDYLKRKKAEPDFIDNQVSEFLKRNYLNDEKFAVWWLERRILKQKSNRAIEYELRNKGVDKEIIAAVLEHNDIGESQRLKQTIDKLRTRSRYQDEKNLKSYLIRQGYNYSSIKEALKEG